MKLYNHISRTDARLTRHLLLTLTASLTLWIALVTGFGMPQSAHAQNGERGKELFERRCSGCHTLDKDKEGPRLRGVYGRVSGSVTSFQYSAALKAAQITWNDATLDKWLADPEQLVANNDMAFRLTREDERREIIAYLKGLTSN